MLETGEYISRDAIYAEIKRDIETYWTAAGGGYYLAEDALPEIENFPAADVAPVRHGAWRKIKIPPAGYDLHGYLCNLCGYVDEGVHTMTGKPFPYCPCCGAKMDT